MLFEEHAAEKPKVTVKDAHGTAYTLIKKIGVGGQGIVLQTNHTNLIVKITNQFSESETHKIRSQFKNVMRLPLRDLKIALPLSLLQLKNQAGYVMRLMDGLEPLSAQVERIYCDGGQLDLIKYRDTGSFERRLNLLKQLAETLAKLHGRGLAFGDLSPSNIFVSKSIEHHQVWLIDADNIHPVEQSHNHHFYTNGYAAPELIRCETGSNIQTDAWSFAVIALQLLTHIHPFNDGIAVYDEDPDITEEKASQGAFPWVFDIEDDSNTLAISGFPVHEMLNKRLFNLFQRCFGKSRLSEYLDERPTIAEWNYEIQRTLSLIVYCQESDCHSSFIVNQRMTCPFCNESQTTDTYVKMRYLGHDQDALAEEAPWFSCSEQIFLSLGQEKHIYHEPYKYFDMDKLTPWCTLNFMEEGLKIIPGVGETVILQTKNSQTYEFDKPKTLKNSQRGHGSLFITHRSLQACDGKPYSFYWEFVW